MKKLVVLGLVFVLFASLGYAVTIDTVNLNGYMYGTNGAVYNAYFKEFSHYGDGVRYCTGTSGGTKCFTYQPQDMSYRDIYNSQDYIGSISSSRASVEGDKVRYNNIFSGIDLEYTAYGALLQEFYTINSIPRQPAAYLEGPLSLEIGGYIKYDTGVSLFVNDTDVTGTNFKTDEEILFKYDGVMIFKLPKPYVQDTGGERVYNSYYKVNYLAGQIYFYVVIPYDYLLNATYPVKVDPSVAPGTITVTYTSGSGTFTTPTGAINLYAECWGGGGGGGGGGSNKNGGDGGGGGAYSKSSVQASPASSYSYAVGAAGTAGAGDGGTGGDSSVGSICLAKGGQGGYDYNTAGSASAGGAAASGTGATKYSGGSGLVGTATYSGSGGGGAGSTGNGGNAVAYNDAGDGTAIGGGNGGIGSNANSGNGVAGSTYGGGGGAATKTGTAAAGAAGAVKITYTMPNMTIVLNSPSNASTTTDTTPTLEFTGTDPGDYDLEYEFQTANNNLFSIDTYDIMDNLSTTYVTSNYAIRETVMRYMSFTGNGNAISNVSAYLNDYSTPSGTVYALIYNHTGTYGTDSKPTGSPLGISQGIDMSIINTINWYTFNFDTPITTINGNYYVLVFGADGGDSSNYIQWYYGSSTHSGNGGYSFNNGSTWTSGSTDFQFKIYNIEPGSILISKNSETDTGFTDVTDGTDTHPFDSGDKISYTVQAGDELDLGTYYWRVRVNDPAGSDTWSPWSDIWQFTIEDSGEDTCTYGGSGNWLIDCADNCVITSSTNLGSNDIITYGTGSLKVNAALSFRDIYLKKSTCPIYLSKTTGGLYPLK